MSRGNTYGSFRILLIIGQEKIDFYCSYIPVLKCFLIGTRGTGEKLITPCQLGYYLIMI